MNPSNVWAAAHWRAGTRTFVWLGLWGVFRSPYVLHAAHPHRDTSLQAHLVQGAVLSLPIRTACPFQRPMHPTHTCRHISSRGLRLISGSWNSISASDRWRE